jgi:GntR family transcriptional regulator, transcriptional repressor for pyruvate dehydrogenase complex
MKNVPHTVTDAAIATIRERIEAGVYPVRSLLPAQRQLSEELAISRASLREALSTLEALGLLVIRPGKGVYVERAQASAAAQSWRFAAQSSLPDTYQMRYALEGFIARMAALAVSDSDLAWFEENITAMQTALACDELDEAARLDYDFHMRIVSIAGNAAIESILSSSADVMKESQRMPFYPRDSAAAGKAIETHISNAAQRAGVYFPTPQA